MKPHLRTMRTPLVAASLAYVRAKGGDPGKLIERFGLPESSETDYEVAVSVDALANILDSAAVEANDSFLGLHIAASLPRGAFGLFEFACQAASSVREAFRRVARYVRLMNDVVTVTFDEQTGAIEQLVVGHPRGLGRHPNEFFVTALLLLARRLSGAHCVPLRVWLAHPAPDDVSELAAVIGRPIEFGAERNGFTLESAVLDLPLVSSDPPLLQLLDRHAQTELASRELPKTFDDRVRQFVRDSIAGGPPAIEAAAKALTMSTRTLQRRLADDGLAFQTIVDHVRADLARIYVGETKRPLGEVAFLVGYSELSAFLRAFRRWTGTTPGEFRKAAKV